MIRFAILGAGGLGKGMARVVQHKAEFQLVAMADSQGYCYDAEGLNLESIEPLATVARYPEAGIPSERAIMDLLKTHGDQIDAIFMALPNLPVEFFANTVRQILAETPFKGVFVDALKRTEAVEHLLEMDDVISKSGTLYITGAGATPGFLTTVAAVAAHSFVEVESVDVHFGVGISCWESYKATVREDLIHLEGFDAEKVAEMSDEAVEEELNRRNGLIELKGMEHADDIILELAGVCPRDRVTVGGLVDTRNAKKPVSTTVTVTGRTVSGVMGSHQFVLSDESTMVDNVCGPALGFLLRAVQMHGKGTCGLLTSADLMPLYSLKNTRRPALATS